MNLVQAGAEQGIAMRTKTGFLKQEEMSPLIR
jgi:hypothetical protein